MKIHAFDDTLIPGTPERFYGQELKWWHKDSQTDYDAENNAYGPNDISYKFNSNGFRSDEFDIESSKRILFMGCSFTFGVGLPLEHTWPHILLTLIKNNTGYNIPFWNLGAGGCGLDLQTRMYYHYGLKLKPQLVFAYFPDYRRELYVNDEVVLSLFLPSGKNNFNSLPYMADQRIIKYETEKNLCFLDLMLKTNNTTMIYNTWAKNRFPIYEKIQLLHNVNMDFDNKARDKSHSGHVANINFAKEIWNNYKDIIIEKLKD